MSIFSERELMVSNSVTLNDLERRNRPNGCVILLNSVAFWGDCVKVVEDTLYFLRQKCRPKNVVFNDVSFMAILAGDYSSDSIKMRHFPLASENLTNNQP